MPIIYRAISGRSRVVHLAADGSYKTACGHRLLPSEADIFSEPWEINCFRCTETGAMVTAMKQGFTAQAH